LQLGAVQRDNHVLLTWVAENEMNTSHFQLERAADGQNFTDVVSKPVAGPINIPTEYKHTDTLPGNMQTAALLFYRVKALDNNGRFAYSNMAVIKPNTNTALQLWPLPCADYVNVFYKAGSSGSLSVSILNNSGQQLRYYTTRMVQGNNIFQVTGMDQLPPGTYYIRLMEEVTRKVTVQRLVRQ
jgi:hypothetical protein